MSKNTLFPLVKKDSVTAKDSLQPIKNVGDSIAKNAMMQPVQPVAKPARDTFFLFRKKHTPKGATLRSLIFPGWGQAYNHEYWKVPLAWAAVGIPIYTYIDNTNEYHKAQFAYHAIFISLPAGQYPGATGDDSQIKNIDPRFLKAYNQYISGQATTANKVQFLTFLQSYRNTFRSYRDYSILATILLWGLQVADATVFGHLREFDVSPDLSLKVAPAYFQYAKAPGITVIMNIK
ncbi:DUF5683 domain-containing protein [Arachidicoccus ginsenosidimutans]|uniref:DUF5683 domain-containing protein n=1 Tax=Arachidicoccus sp. BS20 TaxID=1850526 RepID=UPI001E3DBC61|nr:DUF5683 domain-containing protein [Arachidicoccus sp. BS20]